MCYPGPDKHIFVNFLDSMIFLVSLFIVLSLWLVFVTVKTGIFFVRIFRKTQRQILS